MRDTLDSILCKPSLQLWGLFLCSFVLLSGCAKVPQQKYEPFQGLQPADIERVKGFLKVAGIEGEVMRIEDSKDFWRAEVNPPKSKDAKPREALLGFRAYRIDKSTGKVTDEGFVGG